MITYDPSLRLEDYVLTIPDDVIYADMGLFNKMLKLWNGTGEYISLQPPRDIMLAKTIPLPNFWLDYNGTEILFNTCEDCVRFISQSGAVFRAEINEAGDWEVLVSAKIEKPREIDWEKITWFLMDLWYGIQILLLNPQTATLFKVPKIEKEYTREGKGKDRKRVVKYIRKHYITAEDIDEALYGKGRRDFERKTMAWYVIGHWRQYKNGTRKFINGYWKGPLREMKRNLDGGRVRQLAIQEV